MFAATFSSDGGGVRFSIVALPVLTIFPLVYGLLPETPAEVSLARIVYITFGVVCAFLLAFALLLGTGEAGINVVDNFLQLFVSPRGTGSFFTRDPFGLRRRAGQPGTKKRETDEFDKVAKALMKMETCVYEDREALRSLSVTELKSRLRKSRPRWYRPRECCQ